MSKLKVFIIKWFIPFTKKMAVRWLTHEGYKITPPKK